MTYDHYQIECYSEEFGIEAWHATPEQFATFCEQMDGNTVQQWGPREWTTAYGITLTKYTPKLTVARQWAY